MSVFYYLLLKFRTTGHPCGHTLIKMLILHVIISKFSGQPSRGGRPVAWCECREPRIGQWNGSCEKIWLLLWSFIRLSFILIKSVIIVWVLSESIEGCFLDLYLIWKTVVMRNNFNVKDFLPPRFISCFCLWSHIEPGKLILFWCSFLSGLCTSFQSDCRKYCRIWEWNLLFPLERAWFQWLPRTVCR